MMLTHIVTMIGQNRFLLSAWQALGSPELSFRCATIPASYSIGRPGGA